MRSMSGAWAEGWLTRLHVVSQSLPFIHSSHRLWGFGYDWICLFWYSFWNLLSWGIFKKIGEKKMCLLVKLFVDFKMFSTRIHWSFNPPFPCTFLKSSCLWEFLLAFMKGSAWLFVLYSAKMCSSGSCLDGSAIVIKTQMEPIAIPSAGLADAWWSALPSTAAPSAFILHAEGVRVEFPEHHMDLVKERMLLLPAISFQLFMPSCVHCRKMVVTVGFAT